MLFTSKLLLVSPHITVNVANLYKPMIRPIIEFTLGQVDKLDLVLLKDRRFCSKSIMMYKILNNLIDIPSCYFIPSHHSLRRLYFIQLPVIIDSFKFSPSVIKIRTLCHLM